MRTSRMLIVDDKGNFQGDLWFRANIFMIETREGKKIMHTSERGVKNYLKRTGFKLQDAGKYVASEGDI